MKNNKGFVIVAAALVVVVLAGIYFLKTPLSIKDTDTTKNQQNTQTAELNNDVDGRYIGSIKGISLKNGINSLVIDYVQWISPCVPNPSIDYCLNGYTVKNDNPLLRTFPISKDVQVKLQTYSHDASGNLSWNQIVPFSEFAIALNNSYVEMHPVYMARSILYWITLNNGVVVDITEQYQP